MQTTKGPFYIVTYEAGAEHTPVPTWGSSVENPLALDGEHAIEITQIERDDIPGACQLQGLLSKHECETFIQTTEMLGFTEDASVSLPRSVRHNENLVWVVDEKTHDIIWERCRRFIQEHKADFGGKRPLGLNRRFRFYKYAKGDHFRPHTDGSWPGSKIIDKKLIQDAYPDRHSQMTFLILLNDDFTGGMTEFYVHKDDRSRPATRTEDVQVVEIRTPQGGVLCFPHGTHPQHCLHSSSDIRSGVKYIIRTDVLFERY